MLKEITKNPMLKEITKNPNEKIKIQDTLVKIRKTILTPVSPLYINREVQESRLVQIVRTPQIATLSLLPLPLP